MATSSVQGGQSMSAPDRARPKRITLSPRVLASSFAVGLLAAAVAPIAYGASKAPSNQPPVHLDRSIYDDPGRPAEEKAEDASRKSLDVYEWLGMGPGMTVADVFPSAGYNTHLLSRVVGPKGKVYSV